MNKYSEIYKYIKSDFVRYGREPSALKIMLTLLPFRNHCFAYTFYHRLAATKNIFSIPAKVMKAIYGAIYGIQIPSCTKIGYGLYIGHGIGIVIHGSAKIGNNCNLSQFTTIGSNSEHAATIGDNVYIGPNVCIVENVAIGNNSTIGAGSVVVKDVPENATAAGVPAKVLSYDNPGRYIIYRCKID
jgi:serine O-acetyltransferase